MVKNFIKSIYVLNYPAGSNMYNKFPHFSSVYSIVDDEASSFEVFLNGFKATLTSTALALFKTDSST